MSNPLARTYKDKQDFVRSLSPERRAKYKTQIETLFDLDDEAAIPSMNNLLTTVPTIVMEVMVERGLDPYWWKSIPAHLWETE